MNVNRMIKNIMGTKKNKTDNLNNEKGKEFEVDLSFENYY